MPASPAATAAPRSEHNPGPYINASRNSPSAERILRLRCNALNARAVVSRATASETRATMEGQVPDRRDVFRITHENQIPP